MLARQTRHDLVGLARTPVALFFALLFPLGFFVVLAAVFGNATLDERSGVRMAQFLAPAMASFGVAMSTFAFLGIGFAQIRFSGVLKRFTGSPLPAVVMLAGRVLAGSLLAALSVVLLVTVGFLLYDLQIIWSQMPGAVLTLGVAMLSFSTLGLAVAALAPSLQAATAMANGFVIPLAFISDMFIVSGDLPDWLEAIGWFFPLKHLVYALSDAFNPFVDAGFDVTHVVVIAAWGLVGVLLFLWGIRRTTSATERGSKAGRARSGGSGSGKAVKGRASDRVPRRDGRPSAPALVGDQVLHANQAQWRDWSSPVFGLAMPVFLVMLLPTVFSGGDEELRLEIAQTVAATMTIYGAGVIALVNMPSFIAEAREAGVLKRWAGTPLPTWAILAGRAVAAVLMALLVMLLAYALAVPVYGVVIPSSWPSGLVVLLVSTISFSALGMAIVSVVHGEQSVLAVSLGSLITLSFFSDIFIIGADFPDWLDAISWFFPLRHAVNAFVDAMAVDASGVVLGWDHLAVVAAWGVAAVLVVLARFSSDATTTRSPEPERVAVG
jgi:ABC-2 type transport system permease protein